MLKFLCFNLYDKRQKVFRGKLVETIDLEGPLKSILVFDDSMSLNSIL